MSVESWFLLLFVVVQAVQVAVLAWIVSLPPRIERPTKDNDHA